MEGGGGIIHPASPDEQKDRISNLPDEIIHEIFAGLRSTKQPAQLTILSKRWSHLWRSYPILDFNLRENPKKFVTAVGLFNDDRFRSLKVVKLHGCNFPSGSSVRFGASLQVLSLKCVSFPGNEDQILNSMIEDASYLESLTLSEIYGIHRLHIQDHPNLKTINAVHFRYIRDFKISGAESLETLHLYYQSVDRFQVLLSPNNNVKVLLIGGIYAIKSKEELNKFISKFPRLESLELRDVSLVPQLEIDAPLGLSKLVIDSPNILINHVGSEPVVQVSVFWRLLYKIHWHQLKRFLTNLSRFQLTLEFIHFEKEITSLTSDGDDDQSPIPVIEHLKFPPHLCYAVAFVDNLFRNCHPKMISFTETRDEIAEKNVLQLQNLWKYLASSCKAAKIMERVENDDGIEEDRESDAAYVARKNSLSNFVDSAE
ncbi:F-box/FBD/LRR-repeat protein At1g16930, partial [Linum grandiflorum]